MASATERAEEALKVLSRDDALEYLEDLRESWAELSKDLGRTTIFYLLTAALFELLIGNEEDLKFAVIGIQFTNSAALQKVLPALAAFLFYQAITQMVRWLEAEEVFEAFYKELHPELYGQDLEMPLRPSPGMVNVGRQFPESVPHAILGHAVRVVLGLAVLTLIPVVFAVQSSFLLIDKYGGGDVLSLVVICLSAAFVLAAIAILLLYATRR
ncbi:hypothetical protein ACGF5F_08140 [Streptomyces sp. NPDC047821]|uniref:hypothetical protein n=1 Tax=Streptomyces sp. NPDC047821 TaxID=3365488 RepID=UPI0037207D3A